MALIVKASLQAARPEEQQRLEDEVAEAGVLRIMSTIPPYYLTIAGDLDLLTEIGSTYRTKPRVVEAAYEDVPDASDADLSTNDLIEFVHRTGYLFTWDDDTQLWCVSGVRDGFPDTSEDAEATDQRSAVIEAIRYLVE